MVKRQPVLLGRFGDNVGNVLALLLPLQAFIGYGTIRRTSHLFRFSLSQSTSGRSPSQLQPSSTGDLTQIISLHLDKTNTQHLKINYLSQKSCRVNIASSIVKQMKVVILIISRGVTNGPEIKRLGVPLFQFGRRGPAMCPLNYNLYLDYFKIIQVFKICFKIFSIQKQQ